MIDPVILSTVASFMMNGVCCVYQMSSEMELREAIRKDIRDEWENIRQEERANQASVNLSSFDASVREEKVANNENREFQGVTRRRSKEIKAEARRDMFLDRMTITKQQQVYIDSASEPAYLSPNCYAPLRRPHEAYENPKKFSSLFDEEFLEQDMLDSRDTYSPSLFPSQ